MQRDTATPSTRGQQKDEQQLQEETRELLHGMKRKLESLHHPGQPTPIETPASLGQISN